MREDRELDEELIRRPLLELRARTVDEDRVEVRAEDLGQAGHGVQPVAPVRLEERIGGFSVIDVPDLDAAIALVRTWPSLQLPGVSVEIRPMVEDYSEFEEAEASS